MRRRSGGGNQRCTSPVLNLTIVYRTTPLLRFRGWLTLSPLALLSFPSTPANFLISAIKFADCYSRAGFPWSLSKGSACANSFAGGATIVNKSFSLNNGGVGPQTHNLPTTTSTTTIGPQTKANYSTRKHSRGLRPHKRWWRRTKYAKNCAHDYMYPNTRTPRPKPHTALHTYISTYVRHGACSHSVFTIIKS